MQLQFKLVAVLLTATAITALFFLLSSSMGSTTTQPSPTPTQKPTLTPTTPTPTATLSPSPTPILSSPPSISDSPEIPDPSSPSPSDPQQSPPTNSSPAYFGLNIPYAYIKFTYNSTPLVSGRQHFISFNYSNYASSDESLPDAAIEYFLLQIYSEKGPIANLTRYVGTAFSSSFTTQTFNSLFLSRNNWLDNRTIPLSGGGTFFFNWTENTPNVSATSGNTTSTGSMINYQDPNTLFMNVTRIASIVFKENTAIVSPTNTLIETLQFEKYDGGFIYNTIVPSDQLAQMDPLKPKLGSSSG